MITRSVAPWVAWVSVAGTGLIAAGAFWLSFTALSDLAGKAGVRTAWVWPLIVDGLIVVSTVAAVALAGRRGTWYPWLLLTGGALVSVTANAIHATLASGLGVPPIMAAVVASVPPVVLVAVTHLTVVLTRTQPSDEIPGNAPSGAAGLVPGGGLTNNQAEAGVFIPDYLRSRGGRAAASEVTGAAQAAGLSLDAVKHARARARHPRVVSSRGSRGWVWSLEEAEGA